MDNKKLVLTSEGSISQLWDRLLNHITFRSFKRI